MRAAQSRLVVNSITLSSFAEGRMRLFGAEIFNNFSVTIVVPESGWKQRIRATYKPQQVVIRKCLPVLAQKLALFSFYLVNEGVLYQVSRQISILQTVSFRTVSILLQFT